MINPKEILELIIFKNKILAGKLIRTASESSFIYDAHYLNNMQAQNLSFNISKKMKIHTTSGINLHPYFAGILPEGLRLKILTEKIKTSSDDLFSLYASVVKKYIGDVHTLNTKTNSDLVHDLKDSDFFNFFELSLMDAEHLFKMEGISGVQDKISTSMINFPLRTTSSKKSYILKLNPKDKTSLIDNEYYVLNLAKKCFIDANNSKIVFDKNKGLLVERFDRFFSDINHFNFVHVENACQFLNKYPAEKYRLSFNDVCSAVNKLSSAPKIEILKLILRYVFSYIVGNGDLHAKNISLIIETETNIVRLSPAYDLISIIVYGDQTMALKLDAKDKNFKYNDFLNFAKRYDINEAAFIISYEKLLKAIFKNYNILKNIPLYKKQWSFLEKTILAKLKDLET